MLSVGIRDLKNRLSHYLRLVKAGHTVLVKDRNEAIAILTKYERNSSSDRLAAFLESEALLGRVIGAKYPKSRIADILDTDTEVVGTRQSDECI